MLTSREVEAQLARGERPPEIEVAGPRERIFFDPARLGCGIVTCGGLCPGINDVIRAIVLSLQPPLRRAGGSTASATATRGSCAGWATSRWC